MNRKLMPLAVFESAFILPAALFFATGAARLLQPAGREPAQTAAQIFYWFGNFGRLGAATMLLAMPAMVAISGAIVLVRAWRRDAEPRASAWSVVDALWRYLPACVVAAATVFAAGVLFVVVSHIITD